MQTSSAFAKYAEAFFTSDIQQIIEKALPSIPADSQYAETVRDVLAWHQQEPRDWEKTWKKLLEKYQLNAAYRKASCDKGKFNIDAKISLEAVDDDVQMQFALAGNDRLLDLRINLELE